MTSEAVLIVDCPHCETSVAAGLIAEAEDHSDEDFDFKYQLVSCPRCGEVLLTVREHVQVGDDEWEWDKPVRVYPPRDKTLSYQVPASIRDAFDEATRCFRARCFTAATIMCRKALEGVVQERGSKERNLSASLKELHQTGVIDDRLFEWSELLRVTGNDAAHGVDVQVPREDAEDALHFTEAIADYIFVFRARFDRFKARRDKVKGASRRTTTT